MGVPRIVTLLWSAPVQGSAAVVVEMTELEWRTFERAVGEIRDARDPVGDLGDEVASVQIDSTRAHSADVHGLRDALAHLADGCRYSTGEGLYEEDLATFKEYGIERS